MVTNFLKIFENESLRWFIGTILVLAGLGITLWLHFAKEKEKRIADFVNNFCKLYKNGGYKLELLVPSGINTLRSDKEIRVALERLANVRPGHSLRHWKDRVEKIGYKKFFCHVTKSGSNLNKHSIETFLNNLEKS